MSTIFSITIWVVNFLLRIMSIFPILQEKFCPKKVIVKFPVLRTGKYLSQRETTRYFHLKICSTVVWGTVLKKGKRKKIIRRVSIRTVLSPLSLFRIVMRVTVNISFPILLSKKRYLQGWIKNFQKFTRNSRYMPYSNMKIVDRCVSGD